MKNTAMKTARQLWLESPIVQWSPFLKDILDSGHMLIHGPESGYTFVLNAVEEGRYQFAIDTPPCDVGRSGDSNSVWSPVGVLVCSYTTDLSVLDDLPFDFKDFEVVTPDQVKLAEKEMRHENN